MEDKEDRDEPQEEELPVQEIRERLRKELKRQTERLLQIGHRAHCTVRNINRNYTRSRPRKKLAVRRWENISTDSANGISCLVQGTARSFSPVSEANKKLFGDLAQEATEVVDEVNTIIMKMVGLLRDAGETDLSFDELSLTCTLDNGDGDGFAALGRDIDSIVDRLTRREHDIDVMFNKFEG